MLAERASRATARRTAGVRPAVTRKLRTPRRPMTLVIERTALAADRAVAGRAVTDRALAERAVVTRGVARKAGATTKAGTTRPARATTRRDLTTKRAVPRRAETRAEVRRPGTRTVRHRARQVVRTVRAGVTHRRTTATRRPPVTRGQQPRGGMTAVIAYARSQVGKRYVTGGEGGGGFDCSGLTKQAYERAGIRLPHSSGAQAARARSVSRSQARAGDLVVGPGHVGIYMGKGMMIDAGNHRTGVVYRKVYSGLRVARL